MKVLKSRRYLATAQLGALLVVQVMSKLSFTAFGFATKPNQLGIALAESWAAPLTIVLSEPYHLLGARLSLLGPFQQHTSCVRTTYGDLLKALFCGIFGFKAEGT